MPEGQINKKGNKLAVIFGILCVCFAVSTGVFAWKLMDKGGVVDELESKVAKLKNEVGELKKVDGVDSKEIQDVSVSEGLEAELRAAMKKVGHDAPTEDEVDVGEYWMTIYLEGKVIENSSIAPWQTVWVGIGAREKGGSDAAGGYAAGFYREGSDGEWKLGLTGQQAPMCDNDSLATFTNIRRAFADTTCYELDGSNTTIGEFYKVNN